MLWLFSWKLITFDSYLNDLIFELYVGNYDIIQQPKGISQISKEKIPFYMFIDEETEAYMRNSSVLNNNKRVGLWRIIIVRNIPYSDARRNGKVGFSVYVYFVSTSFLPECNRF